MPSGLFRCRHWTGDARTCLPTSGELVMERPHRVSVSRRVYVAPERQIDGREPSEFKKTAPEMATAEPQRKRARRWSGAGALLRRACSRSPAPFSHPRAAVKQQAKRSPHTWEGQLQKTISRSRPPLSQSTFSVLSPVGRRRRWRTSEVKLNPGRTTEILNTCRNIEHMPPDDAVRHVARTRALADSTRCDTEDRRQAGRGRKHMHQMTN